MCRQAYMTLAVGLLLGSGTILARAGPCGEEIERLETVSRGSASNPDIGPTARQTLGAQLHYEPTPDSVARAEQGAEARVDAVLARARAFDQEGSHSECMSAVEEAKLLLDLQ